MTPEEPLSDRIEEDNEDDFADAEITNICLCEKDREDAKERTIKLIEEGLRASDRFCQGRASVQDLIKSDKLTEAALRYLCEKYNFTEEEIEELKEEAARRHYLWKSRLCFPHVIEKKGGYRIYFPDEKTFRQYLRDELQRLQRQSVAQSHPQRRQRRQQQPHNSQNSQTSQTTLSEFEARALIKRARSILEGY